MQSKLILIRERMSLIFTIVIMVLATLLVGVRIFGYTPYVVMSGSMSPNIIKGSIAYVKHVPLDQIKEGIPITYVIDKSGLVVTHRAIKIDSLNELITTKGDANKEADSIKVHYSNVLGIVKYHIPYLGYASRFLHSSKGIALIILLMLSMVMSSVIEILRNKSIKLQKGN